MNDEFFIDMDVRQISETGRIVSGDVYLSGKRDKRIAMVLSDGAGSGIRTNVVATTIASMALGYALSNEEPVRAAKSIVETFARGEKSEYVKQATFTVITMDVGGEVTIVEFENPFVIITRENKIVDIPKKSCSFRTENGIELTIYLTKFKAMSEDRIVTFTDGVTLSGYATKRMPHGWKESGVIAAVEQILEQNSSISAADLANIIVKESEKNDLFTSKNDTSCATIYFRKPRKILVCTGPPFSEEKDRELTRRVVEFDGNVIISGGTTSQIIARETGRDLSVVMKRDPSRLPPVSKMDGMLMVTEGVLTLSKVKLLLESVKNSDIRQNGIDASYARYLLQHDDIFFLVGSRINAVHQDPKLPVEIEFRRSIVRDLSNILKVKFMKNCNIEYI